MAGRTFELYIPGVIRLGPTGSLEYLPEALGPAATVSYRHANVLCPYSEHTPTLQRETRILLPIGCWLFDGRTHDSLSHPNRQSMHHECDHSSFQSTSSDKLVF